MKRFFAAVTAALLLAGLLSGAALASSKTTNLWSVWNINAGGAAYVPTNAPATATSLANFTFPESPTTALLTTSQTPSLLGDLTGKTITATFTITASQEAAFTYSGAGSSGDCGTPASVRLYFEANTNGKFTYDTAGYSKYWWSHAVASTNVDAYTLAGGTFTLTVPLDVNDWSDWGGEPANSIPTYFANAVANVDGIGLSFGGGCFYANGVGLSAGSASFTLTSYSLLSFDVNYFTVSGDATYNTGGGFCRSAAPRTSVPLAGGGTASQAVTSSGAVTLTTTGVTTYADNGFYVAVGTLGALAASGYTVTASGTPVATNVYFDTGGDGSFFAWDANGCLTGLNGDTYASMGSLTVTGTTSMYVLGGLDAGTSTYTLSQLASGTVPGFSSTTPVAVWVGFVGNGSATITAAP